MAAGGRLQLNDPQALDEMRDAIAAFAVQATGCLAAIDLVLRREQDRLAGCVARRQVAVERAREALARAEAQARVDRRGEDGAAAPVQTARRALAAADEALETARRGRAAVEAAAERYRRQERALLELAGPHSDRARVELRELSERYAAASAAAHDIGPRMASAAPGTGAQVASTPLDTPENETQFSTLVSGPFAGESIPARGAARDFTREEREAIDRIGYETGCHTCGSKNPGTKSGHFIPDHQPISNLNYTHDPQRLYPHCLACSHRQGGVASVWVSRQLKIPL